MFINNHKIIEVKEHKHLGVFFSGVLSWHHHFDYVKTKAWQRIHIMLTLTYELDRRYCSKLYVQLIFDIFMNMVIFFSTIETKNEIYELDKIQNEAARISTGATK